MNALGRWRGVDHPDYIEAARTLAAVTIGEAIDDVVSRSPRLNDDQLADLVARLRPPVAS